MNDPIKIFISYSHQDDELRKELTPHLASAKDQKLIELWHDREIKAGADWAREIDEKLDLADIILFLVSADFIDSRYCSGIEMKRAIERHQDKTAWAIPVIIRFSDWTTTRLNELQAIPRDNRPVTSWGNTKNDRDEPWLEVAKEISQVAQQIKDQRTVKAKQKEEAKSNFRTLAQDLYKDGVVLSHIKKELLEQTRQQYNLTELEAREIEEEVKAAHQQHHINLEKYENILVEEFKDLEFAGKEEFNSEQRRYLRQLANILGIDSSEAKQLENKVFKTQKPKIIMRNLSFAVVFFDGTGKKEKRTMKKAKYFTEHLPSELDLSMVYIPGGTFQMGSLQGHNDEKPQHDVTVSSFLMGKYPVTQEQWQAVTALPRQNIDLKSEPSNFKDNNNHPVEGVSWNEAVEFCERLSQYTDRLYRLPSEAEWEYACRAKTKTNFYFGDFLTPEMANYGEAVQGTSAVNIYWPNAFGLYDMHGNVWEWCQDHYCSYDSNLSSQIDDTVFSISDTIINSKIQRGGSWKMDKSYCRTTKRYFAHHNEYYPDVGFRLVCEVFSGLF
jgi:formylglycine-generating enzyme required for sulfatase activity